MVPRHVLQAQRDIARHGIADDDVLAAGIRQQLQHRAHFDVLEVQGEALAGVFLAVVRSGLRLRRRLHLDHVLVVALVGQLFEVGAGSDDHACLAFGAQGVDVSDGRSEVGNVVAARECIGQLGTDEVDDHLAAFLTNIHGRMSIRQTHDDAPRPFRPAAEIDVLEAATSSDTGGTGGTVAGNHCRWGRRSHAATAGGSAHGQHDAVAIDAGLVGHECVQIQHHAGATTGLASHQAVDATGLDVDATRGQSQRYARQVQGNACWLVDGEGQRLWRGATGPQAELHLLPAQCLEVHGFESVGRGRCRVLCVGRHGKRTAKDQRQGG